MSAERAAGRNALHRVEAASLAVSKTVPIGALRLGMCRFVCTPADGARTRYCGHPTVSVISSWCPTHLALVRARR